MEAVIIVLFILIIYFYHIGKSIGYVECLKEHSLENKDYTGMD